MGYRERACDLYRFGSKLMVKSAMCLICRAVDINGIRDGLCPWDSCSVWARRAVQVGWALIVLLVILVGIMLT